MHIPDGFLSTPVWATLDVVSLPTVGYLARRAQANMEESKAPLMGVLGAFVFAAQMVNFPVGLGTSGHLVGGTLLACTVGPAAAAVIMTAILTIQAFLFQDGGVLALGANVFNLGVAGVLAGYLPYHFWGQGRFRNAAVFTGGFLSVVTGAMLALLQLAFSGVPMNAATFTIPAALFVINGVLEGAITVAVLQGIERINPGWIRSPGASNQLPLKVLAISAVVLAGAGFLIASASPDGLEAVAARLGIAEQSKALIASPMPDYQATFLTSEWMGKAFAGLAGLVIVYVLCAAISRVVIRRRSA
jgi:cobalt/nickel transport system permease protein